MTSIGRGTLGLEYPPVATCMLAGGADGLWALFAGTPAAISSIASTAADDVTVTAVLSAVAMEDVRAVSSTVSTVECGAVVVGPVGGPMAGKERAPVRIGVE